GAVDASRRQAVGPDLAASTDLPHDEACSEELPIATIAADEQRRDGDRDALVVGAVGAVVDEREREEASMRVRRLRADDARVPAEHLARRVPHAEQRRVELVAVVGALVPVVEDRRVRAASESVLAVEEEREGAPEAVAAARIVVGLEAALLVAEQQRHEAREPRVALEAEH